MATAPFGDNKELSKTMYAKQMAILEEEENRIMNEKEPRK